ncbi:exopolyphosphatase [Nocardioides sp. Root1257]|uniref:Ppx/GppA phosphatase family protein n=1 Tax=unclassified Nocardioides TaxID=2615069 RepID=UPI0006FF22B5|nr:MULTISPECIES: Ppx/GppA phosphatase family protein [unclassified Nocardioides]KQW48876.1 exopolyphosphatase [Nocardioides sp. Root1257]KRC48051.1 exopolyphosphatase [Nocardioides sp. Root224]
MRGRVAAIDCGTNTIKLLIGALPDVDVREMRMVRLGQDLDRTGRIADEALVRAFAAIDEYAALIASYDVPPSRVRFVATSASRDASNADVFVAGVRARLGIEPEVVSGDVEAALSFDGAARNLREAPALPVLVVDIGGGSTELILGRSAPDEADSMDIGSVRLHERHLHSDPPTAAEIAACTADIEAHLDACPVRPADAATVVGVAGTVTQLAAVALDLTAYSRADVDQLVLPAEQVFATVERLLAMTVAERRALPAMHPGRADVIGAGVLILDRVLRRTRASALVVSDSDILDGIAWSVAAEG